MKGRRLIIKSIFFAIIVFAWNICVISVAPLIGNSLAMEQMYNSPLSNMWIQVYNYIANYSVLILILVAIMLFRKELKYIFKKNKGEESNEKI